jgi:Fe-S-cluster containining protein
LAGCGIYEKRPDVCRNYPVYPSYTKEQIKGIASRVPEYHPECSEWPKIEAVNV